MLEAVPADRGGVLVRDRPADVVVAAQVRHPAGGRRRRPQPGQRPRGQPRVPGRERRPEQHHELVVVGEVALGPVAVVRAEVLHEHVRGDDRLGLEQHARGGEPGQRPVRLDEQVRLGLVLAVGAHPLPEERHRVQPQHVDPVVGQVEHRVQHRREYRGVRVVEVPLVVVEGRPHPAAHLGNVGEAAGRGVREDLRQRPLVRVRQRPVREDEVEIPVRGIAGRRQAGPPVLPGGVVEHQVDAQRHAAGAQVGGQRLQVAHGAEARIDRVVVDHRVAAVVGARRGWPAAA